MKFISYSRYFFYIAYNWTFAIARHIVRHEIRGEKEYGINSTGADELKGMEAKGIDISHATIYMPASYDLLENLFNQLTPTDYNHFVDIGSGKGRAMCVAAAKGFKKVTGIDFSKDFCVAALENLSEMKTRIPALQYKVINNDAFYFEIDTDVDCIFMFNPFDEIIMNAVINNIEKSLRKLPRDITLIYCNPLHRDLFFKRKYVSVYHTQTLKYLEADILLKKK